MWVGVIGIIQEDCVYLVYCISEGPEGPTKVGYSGRLRSRYSQIQTGNPRKLFLSYWGVFYMPRKNYAALGAGQVFATSQIAAQKMEGMAISSLRERGHHMRGEWFDLPPIHVAGEIEIIADRVGAKHFDFDEFEDYLTLYGPKSHEAKAKYSELMWFQDSLEFAEVELKRFRDMIVDRTAADLKGVAA